MNTVVIGIGGGSASGKSTIAASLVERLGEDCGHIVHDRYYHSLPSQLRHSPMAHNFDHPDALDTARLIHNLSELRAGRFAELPKYDFATHTRLLETDTMQPRPVILVEGILVLADEGLVPLMDHRIYVEAPQDVRLQRRIARDRVERGRSEEEVRERFLQTVQPMHERFVRPSRMVADLVIQGTDPVEDLVQKILIRMGL